MGNVGIKLNLKNGGLTQLKGWEFNSFAVAYGTVYGAGSSGLCKLCGDTDAGVNIDAAIVTPNADFTIESNKRVRRAYFTGSGGSIKITQATEGNEYAQTIACTNYITRKAIKGNRRLHGLNWSFTIQNVSGNYFCVDTLSVLFNPLTLSRGCMQ